MPDSASRGRFRVPLRSTSYRVRALVRMGAKPVTESSQTAVRSKEQTSKAVTQRWVALLGRRDTPTDGVEDYCSFLGEALAQHQIELDQSRVKWAENGWLSALRSLWAESANWGKGWVLLQYAAMAWSRRGFPLGALAVLAVLRRRGLRCAVVFHEPFRQGGERWIDRLRGRCQDWVILRLYSGATKAVFLDPLEKLRWIPAGAPKAAFIPIGPNLPETLVRQPSRAASGNGGLAGVSVFCLSDPPILQEELGDIAEAVRVAVNNGQTFRLTFLGRGTAEARGAVERAFVGMPIGVDCLGLLSSERVAEVLEQSDAMLCVRGPLYMRRGSAIAGIASGLAILGYQGAAEGTPLADAGVALVPYRDGAALGEALSRVLKDRTTLSELQEKSRRVYEKHFSWSPLASRLIEFLGDRET